LYEDERFLAALPDAVLFAGPDALPHQTDGDAAMPTIASDAMHELSDSMAPLIAICERARATQANESSDASRAWTALDVSFADSNGSLVPFAVDLDITELSDGQLAWTIHLSTQSDTDPLIAEGTHQSDGSGTGLWHTDLWAEALAVSTSDHSWSFDYAGTALGTPTADRRVSIAAYPEESGIESWTLLGDTDLLLTGWVTLGEDDSARLASSYLRSHPVWGGRVEGWRWELGTEPTETVDFVECWSLTGDRQWFGEDEVVPADRVIDACGLADPLIP